MDEAQINAMVEDAMAGGFLMEGLVALFIAPLLLFVIFVAPIWVILHYRSKNKISAGLNHEEAANIRELAQRAQSMQERIRTLEAILDEGHAGWRREEGMKR